MLFTTPTEWAALGLTLLAGWLFGFASNSGGKKWKQQLEDEEVASAANRHEWETALRDANARIQELEKQRDATAATAPAPIPVAETSGSSAIPLAAAAGAGAVAATLLHGEQEEAPVAPAHDAEPAPGIAPAPATDPVPGVAPVQAVDPVPAIAPVALAEPVQPIEPVKTWIPEGPPPAPLAMGTPEPAPHPEPRPITPDAPAEPAPVPAIAQEEVKAEEPDQPFLQQAPAAAVTAADPGTAASIAPSAPIAVDASAAPPLSEPVQKGHEWLPPHVRADEPANS